MSWLDRIAARAGVERDWNTGVNTSAQTSAPADDSAWKYISAGDLKGLDDYMDRKYDYHKIPYIGQGIGHTANNATMGVANLAQFLGAEGLGNFLYEKAKAGEEALPETRKPELSLSYVLDPNGLTSAAAQVVGSVLSMAPVALFAPVGGLGAMGAAAVSNIPRVGLFASRFVPGAVRWAATGPVEAMMEGGGTERELLENGASRETANQAAWDVFKENAALLTATNALEGGLLGKLFGPATKSSGRAANAVRSAVSYAPQTAAEALLQGYEEGAQEGIQAGVMGKGANTAAQILNPGNWTEEQWDAAKFGFAGGLPLVGGAALMRRMGRKNGNNGNAEDNGAVAATDTGTNSAVTQGVNPPDEDAPSSDTPAPPVANDASANVPDGLTVGYSKWAGQRMDNGSVGCVEAVTKIGCEYSPFLAQELEKGNVYVPTLVQNAGDMVIPFSPEAVERGDVIVYGNDDHVVIADGEGGYVGNSSSQEKVVHGTNYMEMDDLQPTKIIKTGGGALAGGTSASFGSSARPVMPNFEGLIADENNIQATQEAVQKLIDTDSLSPEEHMAIIQAAEALRDTPVGNGEDALAEAEHVNEWQSLIDRKDAKGIFEKDPQRVAQAIHRLGKEQRAQKTRAAIENQQQIEATKQALQAAQARQNVQGVPAQTANTVQQVVPNQGMAQPGAVSAPENVMQNPQMMQDGGVQTMPQNVPVQNVLSVPAADGMQTGTQMTAPQVNTAPMPMEAVAAGMEQSALPMPQQVQTNIPQPQNVLGAMPEELRRAEAPLLTTPAYAAARRRGDWGTAAQIAAMAQMPQVAQYYRGLGEQVNAAGTRAVPNVQQGAPRTAGTGQSVQQRAPRQALQMGAQRVQPHAPVVGVRPNVPATLPTNEKERAALGRALGRFLVANKIMTPGATFEEHLVHGHKKAIMEADKKIAKWEKKRTKQERAAAQNAYRNTAQTAQEGAQAASNGAQGETVAQRSEDAQNASETVRGETAQNQSNKKTANDGGGVVVTGNEFGSYKDLKELRKKALQYYKEHLQGTSVENELLGKINIDDVGLVEFTGSGKRELKNSSAKEEKLLLVKHLPELIRDATDISGKKSSKENHPGEYFYYLHTAAEINGQTTPVEITLVKRNNGAIQYYNHTLPTLEKSNKNEGASVSTEPESLNEPSESPSIHAPSSTSTISSEAEESKEKSLNEGEREAVKGLSADAKNVYRLVRDKLSAMKNKKVARAASVSAVLLSGHADVIARKVRAALGKPFTAMDYYNAWVALQYGGEAGGLHQAAMKKSDALNLSMFSRQMRNPDEGSGSRNKTFLRMTAPSGAFVDVAQDDMIHMHNHHPEMTDEDFGVIQENMENFLRVHQDKTGKGDYGGQTVLCKIKTPRGVAGVVYELLPTGRIFLKTAFFDNENSIDSWITKNGTSKDLMYPETEKRGDAASMLTGHPSRTADAADSLTPSVARPLSLFMIQERIGIVNGEVFNQRAWHGSPHDFEAFDLGAIGTGEGAQAHGWGLYFAKRRWVSERYKETLKRFVLPRMLYDGKDEHELEGDIKDAYNLIGGMINRKKEGVEDTESLKKSVSRVIQTIKKAAKRNRKELADVEKAIAILKENPNISLEELEKNFDPNSSAALEIRTSSSARVIENLQNVQEMLFDSIKMNDRRSDQVELLDLDKFSLEKPGKLFKVEIPDDDVLLDEQKSFDEQPKLVQEKLEELYGKESTEEYLNRIFENPYNDPALRITFVTFKSAKRNIERDAENAALLRDVLDRTKSPKERTSIFRDLDVYSSINPDHLVYTHSDDLQNIESSRPYLEKMLAYFEEHQRKQERSYAEALETLRGVTNPVAMLHGMNGRAIYTDLSRKCGGDKDASLALNEAGIKGITYDGRRDGRCYVIFDDKAISIIEKFNQQMNAIIKGTTTDTIDGQRIISLFESADESTMLHEMGHLFLLDLERLADMSPTSAEELQTVRKWAAWSEGQLAEYKDTPFAAEFAALDKKIRAALKSGNEKEAERLKRQWEHERFARGFERYLMYGEAPTKGLRAVFAKFRAFLQRVYQAFTGTGGRATPEVEAVMARMISIEDKSDLTAYPRGKETNVYTDSGKALPVQYRVVSADDLIASHMADDMTVNPGYPSALQPRDRERVMMRQQVDGMAGTLRPEDLGEGRNLNQGAPLIRSDGVVLNGNGRTIAIRRAQKGERGAAYRDYIMQNAETFGLKKEDVAGVENPVLVREVQGDISAEMMQDIVGSTTGGSRMGASENAQQDAGKVTYGMMDAYVPNDKGDITSAANRRFVAGILHKLVGKDEMNAYLDKDGHVNADGIQRVKRALFALAYGDDELVAKMSESSDDDIRNVSNGLMTAAPLMARLPVKKGALYVKELQDAIGAAVKQLDTLRRSGESVKDYLSAQALFSEHEDSNEMRLILDFLDANKRSGKRIATFFSRVARTIDGMEEKSANDLFETVQPSLMEVLEGAKAYAENGGQEGLFGEYIAKEADALYEKAARKFPGITDKEVADHVREAIQLTLDFGHGKGEIRGVAGTYFGKEKLPSERFSVDVDDYRSSGTVRDKKTEKELKRGKIYGLGITRKLVNDGAVSLVGQKAESAADLAEIAQVLRHHGYEKFHYVYTDDAGNVKFHETVTARLPANAPIFMPSDVHGGRSSSEYLKKAQERIVTNMSRFGATKFYLVHNHPSGDPTPSREDFNATQALIGGEDIALANAFGGHVILDHNIYSVIDKTGTPILRELKNSYQADYSVPEKPHAVLGTVVTDEDVTQRIADLYGTESETTAFYLTTKGVVRSVQKIHDNFKDVDGVTQINYLRYCARSVGGFRVILATSNKKLYDSIKDRINSGRDEGILDVVLMKNGRARYPEEKFRSTRVHAWFGQPYTSVRPEQVLENKSQYGSASTVQTLDDVLQLAPALKKAALEYGAKDERGKVTFADEERKQEFLKVAKALLGAGERKPSARRQEALKEMLDGIRLVPPNRLSPRKRVIADWGREMGVPVVFFKGDPHLHGYHSGGVTFLNVDSEITPQWTFWHEAMHWMRENNPDIYNELVRAVSGAEGFTKEQLDAYRREIGAPQMSDADVVEEMLADALPDVRRRVPLLREIGKRDTNVIQRFVAWVHDVMRRFHDHFHTPKGGLTTGQRRAMVGAFGNLVGSLRDADRKPIFRIENDGARITLRDGSRLPAVKYSLDNAGKEGDNEGRISEAVFQKYLNDGIMKMVRDRVSAEIGEHIDTAAMRDPVARDAARDRLPYIRKMLADYNTNTIQNKPAYRDRLAVKIEYARRCFDNDPRVQHGAVRQVDGYERPQDLHRTGQAAVPRRNDGRGMGAAGRQGTRGVSRSISGERAGAYAHFEQLYEDMRRHLEQQGAFSTPKFSANTNGESRTGNFKWLTGAIRSLVGVAPADNLELPGRPQRTVTLTPKELERKIKGRWIQEKNIISKEEQKDGSIKVTFYPDAHDVGFFDWVKSVRQVAKRNPFVKVFYKRARAAMKKQEHLRNEFGKVLKTFADLVKNPEDLKTVSIILWLGDAKGKVYTDAELRSMGASENAIKAYKLVREVLERAYKMLNDARMQVQTRSQTMAAESVETFKKNHWIKDEDVISVQPQRGGQVLLTWRGGKTYETKDKMITAEALELMKKDDDVIVTRATPLSPTQYGEGMYEVDYVERIKPIHRLTGYMPHFFHEWIVYEKYQDPNTGQIRYTTIGSGRTMNEAVKIGNEIAAKNKDKQYVLRPKGFDLGVENSVVIGDMDFAQMTKKLAESTEISLADARSILLNDAGATLRARHRFFGSLLERKGAEGFDQDVMWVLAHYLNSTARYVAMEEFKPWAISMYERFFGAFDAEPKNLIAKYCKDLINDVNGNPRWAELGLTKLIKKTWVGKRIADSYGDRVALALNGELSTWNAITKLGLFNFASAAVNFSQFINIGAALNDYGYAMRGLKRAVFPSEMDDKIIEASGLLDDINAAADNGGYTQRRGSRVRGIYSGIKHLGELSLIPFQTADMLMRKAAVLGAYYQGVEQKGMKKAPGDELSAEAIDYAQEINDDANFDYSAANAPALFRMGSVVTQQMSQFQKYPIMQFEFMWNILTKGTRGQKVRFFVPYVLFCGMFGSIPFGDLLNQLFSGLFAFATGDDDEDIAQEIKAEILRWAGKDPVKKAIAETAIYGVLAPTFGIDISGRIGMSNAFSGEFYGKKPDTAGEMIVQQLGGPALSSVYGVQQQMKQGNPIEALKAVSPALGNMVQAYVGESRTTRHRVNARYDTVYDKLVHAFGFRSVEESKNSFITNYEYEQKSKLTRMKQEAIQEYINDPSDENRCLINALGITERQIKEARIQQERTSLERATEGRPKTSGKGASRQRKEDAKKGTLYDTLDDE